MSTGRKKMHIKRLSIFILMGLLLLLLPACHSSTSVAATPTNIEATSVPTEALPLSSPVPLSQAAMMLPGMPPIPADLTKYTLRVDIDLLEASFEEYARIDYTNTEGSDLDSLFFRLYPNLGQSYGNGMIKIDETFINGKPAAVKTSFFDSIVEVPLAEALKPNEKVKIEFELHGTIPADIGGDGSNIGYGVYSISNGVVALANFYPILAVYQNGEWKLDTVYGFGDSVFSDAALYTVELVSDADLIVTTSGRWVSQQEGQSKISRTYVSGPARDFFIIGSREYQITSKEVNQTKVNSYYLPGNEDGGIQAADIAARALKTYNELFGPYPYKELDIVEAPLNRPSGVEYPGLALIASRLYTDLTSPTFNTTVAHEVAHQWWYNTVGNDVIGAPWMDEALTTYSSILYWEKVVGNDGKQQILAYYQDRYDKNVQNGMDAMVTAPMVYFQADDLAQAYSPVVYAKGGLFFEALRSEIGDEAFFTALKQYYSSHWFTIATSDELLAAFQSATNIDLSELYRLWLYSPEPSQATPTSIPEPTKTPVPSVSPTPTLTPTRTATAAPTPTPTSTPITYPLVFAAIGDYGGANDGIKDVADLIKSWQPEFIITMGDNNYWVGAADHIDLAIGQYFHNYIYPYLGGFGAGADINRFFPVLGNHDLITDNGRPYLEYFTLPGNERYYDFVWGPVHCFAINDLESEPDGVSVSSTQAAWLEKKLTTSTAPWNIVYMHFPPYSSSSHGPTDWAQWPYREWGADAVLSGHDHVYERLFVDGLTYFVNGMGGYALYGWRTIVEGSQIRYNADYGALRIEATENNLLFEFINRNNKVIDAYSISQ